MGVTKAYQLDGCELDILREGFEEIAVQDCLDSARKGITGLFGEHWPSFIAVRLDDVPKQVEELFGAPEGWPDAAAAVARIEKAIFCLNQTVKQLGGYPQMWPADKSAALWVVIRDLQWASEYLQMGLDYDPGERGW